MAPAGAWRARTRHGFPGARGRHFRAEDATNRARSAPGSLAAIQFFHVQLRVGPSRALQLEPVDGGTCGEGRGGLQREHAQRLSWSPREPFQREVRHYWYLSRHEKLPEMSRGSLVGFVHDAEYRNVNQHQSQGGYGHCEWKQSARLLHRWDVHQHLRG